MPTRANRSLMPRSGSRPPSRDPASRRIRDRRRRAGPHQFLADGAQLRRHGLSPGGQPYLVASGQCRLAQGRARAEPQHLPCRGACWSTARSPRRAPASRSRGPGRFHHPSRADGPGSRACPSIPIPMAHSVSEPSPKPGYLFVRGPDDDYVFQAIGSRVVLEGQPGGGEDYSHAYAVLDLKPGMGSQEVNLVVRRGATVEGRVVGPDGQPVREAWIFSRLILDPSLGPARYWTWLLSRQAEPMVASRSAGLPPMPRSPPISSSRSASWGPSSTSRPVGGRRAGHRPARALRGRPGVARRSRRQAGREAGANLSITMVVTPGPVQQRVPERQDDQPALRRRRRPDRRRPDQLRDGPGPRGHRPDHAPRPDPGRDVSLHRLHHVRPRPGRPGDPQGIHRQAGPEAQPGRYPDRQAFAMSRPLTRSARGGRRGARACPLP